MVTLVWGSEAVEKKVVDTWLVVLVWGSDVIGIAVNVWLVLLVWGSDVGVIKFDDT